MAKRRGNGEGSITRRKDGRWEARYTACMVSGPKRKVIYGKTRAEVAEKLAKAISDRSSGLTFDAGSLTVGEFLDSGSRTPSGTPCARGPTNGTRSLLDCTSGRS